MNLKITWLHQCGQKYKTAKSKEKRELLRKASAYIRQFDALTRNMLARTFESGAGEQIEAWR